MSGASGMRKKGACTTPIDEAVVDFDCWCTETIVKIMDFAILAPAQLFDDHPQDFGW